MVTRCDGTNRPTSERDGILGRVNDTSMWKRDKIVSKCNQ